LTDVIVEQETLNTPIDNPFKFEPRIKGKAYWAALNRLVFEPEDPLPSRINYQAKLDLKAINESFEVEKFDFKFYVEGLELVSFNGELELLNPANPKQTCVQWESRLLSEPPPGRGRESCQFFLCET